MKNKLKNSLRLFMTIIFLSNIVNTHTQNITLKESESTIKIQKKSTWSKMIDNLSAFFYKKKSHASKKPIKVVVEQPTAQKPALDMSREQAIEGIRNVTTKLFDPNDVNHITLHLNRMKEFSKFLDNVKDKKLIAAIHFLLENHHRSSITDIVFWTKAIKDLEIDIVIPMTPEIIAKPKSEKLMLLHKKMTINN